MMDGRRLIHLAAALVMAGALLLAGGCRLVGYGTLDYVPVTFPSGTSGPEERAATTGSPATVHAFRADPGDP